MNIGIILISFLVSIGIEVGLIFGEVKIHEMVYNGKRKVLWVSLFVFGFYASMLVGLLALISGLWLATWYWNYLSMAVAA